jgi:hypothetical protein
MTAPKDQLSIWPANVELTQAVDLNYVAGMVWNRSPQLRLTWRPSKRFNWATSVENPEQQLGSGVVTLPQCCAADIDAQYNTGADELRTPNLMEVGRREAARPVPHALPISLISRRTTSSRRSSSAAAHAGCAAAAAGAGA